MQFCEACGAPLAPTGRFCGQCGEPRAEPIEAGQDLEPARSWGLERFSFAGILGRGGSGTVYLAHDALSERDVAVKLIDPARADSPGYLQRFLAEVQALESVSHPNVVRVVGHGRDGGSAWVATEYVPGATLRQLIDHHGPLEVPQALGVLSGALAGLAHTHAAGVLHGDLTPSNVLVDRRGNSLLADFGESIGPSGRGRGVTAAYASPEAAQGLPMDGRSDLYSMGAVLYECLAGRPPFPTGPPEVVLHRQVTETPATVPGVASPIRQLLDAALDKDPSRRPQCAEDFLAALEGAAVAAEGTGWRQRASIAALVAVVGAEIEDMTAPASASTGRTLGRRTLGRRTLGRRTLGRRSLSAIAGHKAAVVATVAVVTAAGIGAGFAVTRTGSTAEPTATTIRPSPTGADPQEAGAVLPGAWGASAFAPRGEAPSSAFGWDVSCPSAARCVVLEQGSSSQGLPHSLLVTTNVAGTAPTLASLPPSASAVGLTGISCPTSRRCYAVGNNVMLTSDDGGRTWTSTQSQPIDAQESIISCPSESTCYVVAHAPGEDELTPAHVSVTYDGGHNWHAVASIGSAPFPQEFECPTDSFCVGWSEHTGSAFVPSTSDGGQSWANWQLPGAAGGTYMPTSVWCDEDRACVVGAIVRQDPSQPLGTPVVLTTPDAGEHWSAHPLGTSSPTTESVVVACSTRSDCVAVLLGKGSVAARATGDGWTTTITDSVGSNLQGSDDTVPIPLACPTANRCLGALGPSTGQPSSLLTRSPG